MAQSYNQISGELFECKPQLDAYYVNTTPWGSSSGNFKVYCPTLMPQVSMGVARSLSPVSLNKTIFCNANDCAISIASRVTPLNYITARAVANSGFSNIHMDYGSNIIIQSFNHDFFDPILTNIKDPSTYHRYG